MGTAFSRVEEQQPADADENHRSGPAKLCQGVLTTRLNGMRQISIQAAAPSICDCEINSVRPAVLIRENALGSNADSARPAPVIKAPNGEIPGGAVPKPAEPSPSKHSPRAAADRADAAERNVDVIADPVT